jgi:DUF917 family protein
MKKFNLENIPDLIIGSAILGSGGGGNACLPAMMAKMQMEKTGPVSLINASDLKPEDVIMPIGFIGAPSAESEKLHSGREFDIMFDYVKKTLNKNISVLMPYEIGGGNSFAPIIEAARLGLPVLDADTMGRAFPESQMSSSHLHRLQTTPAFMTDSQGNTTVIYASDTVVLEKIGRQVAIAMGSTAAFGFYPLKPEEIKKGVIPKSISKAISIGKAVREARRMGKDPFIAVLELCKGIKIGSGRITDIDRSISRGFLYGKVVIENNNDKMVLNFQNEFLVAKKNESIVATTPDILMLLEQETGTPIDSPSVQYGLKVHVIALPAPTLWTTPEGLELVGPRHFGYEVDYQPISSKKTLSIGIAHE